MLGITFIFKGASLDEGLAKRGRRRARRIAALGALLIAGFSLSSPARAETLREALEIALRSNPDLGAQYEVLKGLNENESAARAGMRPSLTGTGRAGYSYVDSSESPRNSHTRPSSATATVTQPLFDGFQTENAVASAQATVLGGRENLRQTEQNVLLDAVTAYIGVIQASQNLELARNDVAVNQRLLQAATDRFNVGEITRTDVAQAEAALAQSQANLATQQGALRQAREAYLRRVGVAPGRLAPLPPLPRLPASLEEAREIARRTHPSILAAQSAVVAAGYSVEQARGALLPQLDLSASATTGSETSNRGSGVMSGQAGVDLTWPLYQGGLLRSNIRRNQALESQRFEELRSVSRQVLEAVGVAWENLETSRATIKANQTAVNANQLAVTGVQEEAKVGARTTLDILEEQQRLLNSQVALVNSRTDLQVNVYTLLASIGVLSIETLGLNVSRPDIEGDYAASQGYSLLPPGEQERREDWLTNFEH